MTITPTVISKRGVPGLSDRALANFVSRVAQVLRLRGVPTILLTGNRQMRQLNRTFRGKDHATDVLSFPSPTFVEGFAGDIAISLDIAAANARSLGHTLAEEVKILVLHGILHLAGYDHESDNGSMAAKEARLRRQLGLPAGIIERVSPKDRKPRAARLRT
jgi:probable rRNA maturation factor